MTDQASFWEDEVQMQLGHLRTLVDMLNACDTAQEKLKLCMDAERTQDELASKTRKSFVWEVRSLHRDQKAPFQTRLEGYDKELAQLKKTLKWAKAGEFCELDGSVFIVTCCAIPC